jgi:hypothetical protein
VGDGDETVADHLEAIAHKNEEAAAQLEMPPLSWYGVHILGIYTELAVQRLASGMGGVNPIQDRQILDWQELRGTRLPFAVVELLHDIDAIFRRANADHAKGGRNPGGGEGARVDQAEAG